MTKEIIQEMFSSIPNVMILNMNFDEIHSSKTVTDSEKSTIISIIQLQKNYPFEELRNNVKFTIHKIKKPEELYVVTLTKLVEKEYQDPFLTHVHHLYDQMQEGVIIFKNRNVIYRNPSLANTLNLKPEEKDVVDFNTLDVGPSNKVLEEYFHSTDNGQMILPFEFPNSDNYWFKISFQSYTYNDVLYHVMMINDISTLKEREQQYKEGQEFLNRTLESVSEAVIITDGNFDVKLINPIAISLLNVKEIEYKDKSINELLKLVDNYNRLFEFIPRNEVKNEELIIMTMDGLMRNVRTTISTIYRPDQSVEGYVIVLIDISAQKKREREILYLSYHDVLTGLYNRTYLEEQLDRLNTKRTLPFAIMMADVNGLKLTNDVFGHHIGDQLLIKVAKIIKRSCRTEDFVGRYGGDEFLILLPNTDNDMAHMIMKRILFEFENLTENDSIKGIIPSISIGYGIKTDMNIGIQEVLSEAETNMYKRKMLAKDSVYSSAITSMQMTLYEKSSETEAHANRLYENCKAVAKHFHLSDSQLDDLELLCMLHDVGKIAIPDKILNKTEPLTKEEWEELKTHPEIGYRIANATPHLQRVGIYILHHHERYDGTGYPSGQVREQIPLLDRILSVADAFDAMTNDRVYQKAISKEAALEELIRCKGTQFDPNIVDIFVDHIKNQMNQKK